MANFTPNVNLEKPLGSEHYLIKKFNANMDKIDAKFGEVAPKDSPELTGVPIAPTALTGTNTNQIATTAFVKAVIAALVDSSPSTLDTLNELAQALGDDPNFATTMATELGLKAPKANPTFTGTQTLPNIVTNGIKFPATQVPSLDPNTLDDYEKGSWTPIPITSSGTITSYTAVGRYIKIGDLVHLYCRVHITDLGTASGSFDIGGLPFAEGQPFAQFVGVEIVQTVTLIRAYLLGSTLKTIVKYDGSNILANNYMYVFNGVYAV